MRIRTFNPKLSKITNILHFLLTAFIIGVAVFGIFKINDLEEYNPIFDTIKSGCWLVIATIILDYTITLTNIIYSREYTIREKKNDSR